MKRERSPSPGAAEYERTRSAHNTRTRIHTSRIPASNIGEKTQQNTERSETTSRRSKTTVSNSDTLTCKEEASEYATEDNLRDNSSFEVEDKTQKWSSLYNSKVGGRDDRTKRTERQDRADRSDNDAYDRRSVRKHTSHNSKRSRSHTSKDDEYSEKSRRSEPYRRRYRDEEKTRGVSTSKSECMSRLRSGKESKRFVLRQDDERDDSRGRNHATSTQTTTRREQIAHTSKNTTATAASECATQIEDLRDLLDACVFSQGTDSFIRIGTPQHEDFWRFVRKLSGLANRRNKKPMSTQTPTSGEASKSNLAATDALGTPVDRSETHGRRFNLPSTYHPKHRINSSVVLPSYHTVSERARARTRTHTYAHAQEHTQISESAYDSFVYHVEQYAHFLLTGTFRKLDTLRKAQANLPIASHNDEIVQLLKSNQVVVLAGDTGCGKSTQLPAYLLKAGYTDIAVTEPRRLACIALAKRVSYETLNAFGEGEIAYQIRFEGTKTNKTKVVFLTEGLLLRQIVGDTTLSQYKVIVMDEVHERNINCDFLLGVIKSLLYGRPDLKFVVMSATINVDLFSQYFDNAPVLEVPGRLHPIEVKYLPPSDMPSQSRGAKIDPTPYLRVLQMIDMQFPPTERGDVLIFLSGKFEIQTVGDALRGYAEKNNRWIILTLHAALEHDQQDKVFHIPPDGVRKCILSTNIAETSVTIDGIRFVVDSGKVKEMAHDELTKMQKLQEKWISRASAEQRKGRAGRTGPGICYRLYSQEDYIDFENYTVPEIQRTPLEGLILQMKALADDDVNPRRFDFVERPSDEAIERSLERLVDHGALLMHTERISILGRVLARLPIDVSLGKMLVMGTTFHVSSNLLAVAALFSVQSPFSLNHQPSYGEEYDARHEFDSTQGDPLTLLAAYNAWLEVKLNGENSKKWCHRRDLKEQRLYECRKLNSQFDELLRSNSLLPKLTDHQSRSRISRTERNRLLDVKRNAMQAQSRRSRKILRLTEARDETGEDAESESVDLHDLDFRLSKGTDGSLASGRVLTAGDTALLSLLVASGLYPNCAIADANNHVRKQSEYVFHTKAKPIVALHPSSVYYSNTEFLTATTVNGAGSINNTGVDSSASNQKRNAPDLFCYGSLIETSKPYLCNVMKIPALPTLLLVAKSVDTNVACDQLLIDDWLLITLGSNKNAVDLLCVALELRKCWAQLVAKRLSHIFATANDSEPGMSESMDKPSSNTREHEFADRSSLALKLRAIGAPGRLAAYLEEEGSIGVSKNSTAESVGEGLVKFMQTKVRYSLVRAKQSELPGLMVWNELAGDANDGNGGNKTDVGVSKKVETASADIESEVMSNTVTVEPGSLEESVSGSTNTGAAETGVSAVVGIVPCVDKTKGGVAISENIRIGSFSGASGDIGY